MGRLRLAGSVLIELLEPVVGAPEDCYVGRRWPCGGGMLSHPMVGGPVGQIRSDFPRYPGYTKDCMRLRRERVARRSSKRARNCRKYGRVSGRADRESGMPAGCRWRWACSLALARKSAVRAFGTDAKTSRFPRRDRTLRSHSNRLVRKHPVLFLSCWSADGTRWAAAIRSQSIDFTGDPGRNRTCDLQIRNLPLYPTELRDHSGRDT